MCIWIFIFPAGCAALWPRWIHWLDHNYIKILCWLLHVNGAIQFTIKTHTCQFTQNPTSGHAFQSYSVLSVYIHKIFWNFFFFPSTTRYQSAQPISVVFIFSYKICIPIQSNLSFAFISTFYSVVVLSSAVNPFCAYCINALHANSQFISQGNFMC